MGDWGRLRSLGLSGMHPADPSESCPCASGAGLHFEAAKGGERGSMAAMLHGFAKIDVLCFQLLPKGLKRISSRLLKEEPRIETTVLLPSLSQRWFCCVFLTHSHHYFPVVETSKERTL